MSPGELHLNRFPFTSGGASKVRPALVLFDLGVDVVICRVSSVARLGRRDVRIADWQAAGLFRPSVARLDRLLTAEVTTMIKPIGALSPADLAAVRSAWNRTMRL